MLLRKIFSIDLAEEDKHWETEEKEHNREPIFFHVEVTNPAVAGKTLGAIREFTGRSFICSRILSKGELSSPTAETVVQEGDVLRIVAAPEDRLPVTAFFGGEKQGVDLATEKSPLATRTILITREKFNGMTLKALALNQMDGVNITRVFRAGMTLFPYSNLHLQVGDQVYCVGPEPALQRLETLLGNKMKKLYHPNIFTIFVGLAFGIVLGSIPIAVPGMPAPLKLGLAGGPLIVAILLGRFGNFARLVTYTTQSASLMMREIGISLFLASVGLAAGESFVAAITQGNGLLYVLLGLFVTLIPSSSWGSSQEKSTESTTTASWASWRAPRPILLRSPTRRPCRRRIPHRSRTRPSIRLRCSFASSRGSSFWCFSGALFPEEDSASTRKKGVGPQGSAPFSPKLGKTEDWRRRALGTRVVDGTQIVLNGAKGRGTRDEGRPFPHCFERKRRQECRKPFSARRRFPYS